MNGDPGDGDAEQEHRHQPDAQGAERDDDHEGDDPHRQPEGDPSTGPEQLSWPPPGGEGIGHDVIQSAQSVAMASRMSSRAARRAGRTAATIPATAARTSTTASEDTGASKTPKPSWALMARIRPQPRNVPDGEPADGTEDGHDHRLPPDGRAQLAAALADGAQQPELTGALVDRQRQRVADPHHGDQHGDGEQPVDHGQHRVDLGPDRVLVLARGLRFGRRVALGDRAARRRGRRLRTPRRRGRRTRPRHRPGGRAGPSRPSPSRDRRTTSAR